LNKNE
jgi:hypothetical protein